MISVTATILDGVTASLELPNAALVIAYVQAQPVQPRRWEIIGTSEEEAEIAQGLTAAPQSGDK